MNKDQAIEYIENVDISTDYIDDFTDKIENRYAAGYLDAKIEELGNSLSPSDEEYRESILEIMTEYNIWE